MALYYFKVICPKEVLQSGILKDFACDCHRGLVFLVIFKYKYEHLKMHFFKYGESGSNQRSFIFVHINICIKPPNS